MERAVIEAQVAAYLAEMARKDPSDAYAGNFVCEHASYAMFDLQRLQPGVYFGGYSYLIFDQDSYEIEVFGSGYGHDIDLVVQEIDRRTGYIPEGDAAFAFLRDHAGSVQHRVRFLRILTTLRLYAVLDRATPWTSLGIHLEEQGGQTIAVLRLHPSDADDECQMSPGTALGFIERLADMTPHIGGISIVDSQGKHLVFGLGQLSGLLAEAERSRVRAEHRI